MSSIKMNTGATDFHKISSQSLGTTYSPEKAYYDSRLARNQRTELIG